MVLLVILQVIFGATPPFMPLDSNNISCSKHSRMMLQLPSTDDVLVSQPYDHGIMTNAWSAYSGIDYMLAEDCYPSMDLEVSDADVWFIYSSGEPPDQFNLGFQLGDTSGPDGTFQWYLEETDLEHELTGYSGWGYDFWHTHINISNPAALSEDQTYWFTLQAQSESGCYWLFTESGGAWGEPVWMSTDNGTTWESPAWSDFGVFLVLEGAETALERSTWGEIKALF